MDILVNRYFKDNQRGFRFALETGRFADTILRNGIERNLIGDAVGNQSVHCWLGGVVRDTRENEYYVFGHNEMKQQEKNSSRLACLFTFALIPFESLHQVGSPRQLMDEISRIEKQAGRLPDHISIREERPSASPIDEQIADELAAFAAGSRAAVELVDTRVNCERALETIWRVSLFARKMPIVALVDEGYPAQPQNCWSLRPGGAQRSLTGAGLGVTSLSPEDYLRFAYGYAMKYELEQCRSALNPKEVARLSQEFGSANDALLEQLLLWHYTLNRGMKMLPTEDEKKALLQAIR